MVVVIKKKKKKKRGRRRKKKRRRRRRRRKKKNKKKERSLGWKLIYTGKIHHSGRRLVPLNHQYAAGGPNQKRNCCTSLHPVRFLVHVTLGQNTKGAYQPSTERGIRK
jgi:hypothetical protein